MANNKRLYKALNKNLEGFDTAMQFKIGITNDLVLKIILKRIQKEPSIDNFIMFTNCLNFFYSTRLQAAVNNAKYKVKTKSRIIITVAKYLKSNWQEGLQLSSESKKKCVDCNKVEQMRKDLKKSLGRGSYSFSTKVFHQLYSNYPILDTNMNAFMHKEGYKYRVNFYNDSNTYQTFHDHYLEMIENIQWEKNDINSFDTSVWIQVTNNSKRYFPKRKKK